MSGNGDYSQAIQKDRLRRRRARMLILVLLFATVLGYFMCICIGSVRLSFEEVIDSILGHGGWANEMIVNDTRAPRVFCAGVVGAALSLGGMAMQALFKNPMASPTVLGISSGASFGAAAFLALGAGTALAALGSLGTVLCAFTMAMVTMMLVYGLAYKRVSGVQTTTLLLAGMAVSAMFGGLVSMIEFFSTEDTVTAIVYWMMGSFDGCQWDDARLVLVPVIIGSLFIAFNLRELDMMTNGESKARALGVNVKRVRIMLLIGSSLVVAGTVAICGSIGFVGLIIPHIFRALVGPDHRRLAPLCILGGALFLMLVDTFARGAMPPYEMPVSTITALIGAPFFLWILRSRKNEIWRQ